MQSAVNASADPAENMAHAARRPAAEQSVHWWHLGMVPRTLEVRGHLIDHPAWRCAVFVVHGMGQPVMSGTAAAMRSGFEDALDVIEDWQRQNEDQVSQLSRWIRQEQIPAPYICDGYWGDYPDLSTTFPEEWDRLNPDQQAFFKYLWKLRVVSPLGSYRWYLKQQFLLLRPRVLKAVGVPTYLIYIFMQFVSAFALTVAVIQRPLLLTKFLGDNRLYLDPKGAVERAIVQRIDYRVGKALMRMLGLDWEFRELPKTDWLRLGDEPIRFERIVWVAHSLGSVISYNVLSNLFSKAQHLEVNGDEEQKQGVQRFRRGLRRFVTMGSPLDKVAFLFGERALRPWPKGVQKQMQESAWLTKRRKGRAESEWWVNFYHHMDPISGALSAPLICHDDPPKNLHAGSWALPGFAHLSYWRDKHALRFILGRTYGDTFLKDKPFTPLAPRKVLFMALASNVLIGSLIIFGSLVALIRGISLLRNGIDWMVGPLLAMLE